VGILEINYNYCGFGQIQNILLITQELVDKFLQNVFKSRDASLATNHSILVLIQIAIPIQEILVEFFTIAG